MRRRPELPLPPARYLRAQKLPRQQVRNADPSGFGECSSQGLNAHVVVVVAHEEYAVGTCLRGSVLCEEHWIGATSF